MKRNELPERGASELPGQKSGSARGRTWRSLGRWDLDGGFGHSLDNLSEVFQSRRRNDNRVAPTRDIFGNAQESAPWVFFQSEQEGLPLDLNLIRLKGIFVYRWFR